MKFLHGYFSTAMDTNEYSNVFQYIFPVPGKNMKKKVKLGLSLGWGLGREKKNDSPWGVILL